MSRFSFILVLAVAFLAVAHVRADVIRYEEYTYYLTTENPTGWTYAPIVQYNMSNSSSKWINGFITYANPTRDTNKKYTSVGTLWKDVENKLIWSQLQWAKTYDATNTNWNDYGSWIAGTVGDSSVANGVANGFYAYKYTMTASDLTELSARGTLELTVAADDYIAAIYVGSNGTYTSLYADTVAMGQPIREQWKQTDLEKLTFDNVGLTDGALELIFIVHNIDNARTSGVDNSTKPSNNASGLYVYGTFNTNIAFVGLEEAPNPNPNPGVVTPEPATLAVLGLGLVGLGLTRIRRRK